MPESAQIPDLVDRLNAEYCQLHHAKEDAFWRSYMGLGENPEQSQKEFNEHELALQAWLQDPNRLSEVMDAQELAETQGTDDDSTALQGWLKTLSAHAIDSEEGRTLAAEIVEAEGRLAQARGGMELGYRDQSGQFHKASSVKLGVMLGTDPEESNRKAAWEGLRSIEDFVLQNGFIEVVKMRNRLGRMLGGEDYYDWKVRRVEGLTKADIFARLDELEGLTRESAQRGLDGISTDLPVTPWNMRFLTGGDLTRQRDPWFPFRESMNRWGRSFAGLGIKYDGATMVLDLLDRAGKYENGFMHGPEVSWIGRTGRNHARIHFTANAIPGMVGSGERATATFFHEGGHAAHFANVRMPAPCFGQEFAPTSVAFAEIQSMLLDSLIGDADWQRRYAMDASGQPMPVELIEQGIRQVQPHAAWQIRAMMAVCYAERAIYELPESELTPEGILAAVRKAEQRLTLLADGSPRPVLSVPHLLSGEASAYYHGYVLAQMGVEQTRSAIFASDGHMLDNPRLGGFLAKNYWNPGNGRSMDDMLSDVTGKPLAAADLAAKVNRSVEEALAKAHESIEREADIPGFSGPVELDASIRVVHGKESIVELGSDGFEAFANGFAQWIDQMSAKAN
ncbi:MAG: peptidase M3 [Phycisphaerae bacterium]|nr:peptidase M3 [Phycisphaerae bacterium]